MVAHQPVLQLHLNNRLYRKLLLFKSFTVGLTVKEFDNICNKEIAKRYHKP
jgi:hypothetical protein